MQPLALSKFEDFLRDTDFTDAKNYSKNKRHLYGLIKALNKVDQAQAERLLPKVIVALSSLRSAQEKIVRQNLENTQGGFFGIFQRLGVTIKNKWYGSHRLNALSSSVAKLASEKHITVRGEAYLDNIFLLSNEKKPRGYTIDLSLVTAKEDLMKFVESIDQFKAKQISAKIGWGDPLAPAIRLEKGPFTPDIALAVRALVLKLSKFAPEFPRKVSLEQCDFGSAQDLKSLRPTLKTLIADSSLPEQLIDKDGKAIKVDGVEASKRFIGLVLPKNLSDALEQDALQPSYDDSKNRELLQKANETPAKEAATIYPLRKKEPDPTIVVSFTPVTDYKARIPKSERQANSLTFETATDAFSLSVNGVTRKGQKGESEDRMVLQEIDVKGKKVVIQGVIDGHNKADCASVVQKALAEKISQKLSELANLEATNPKEREEISVAIKKAFIELKKTWNEYVEQEIKNGKAATILNGGADVNCAIVIGNYVFCANLGDSKSMFIPQSDTCQILSPDTSLDSLEGVYSAALRGHAFETKKEETRDDEIRIIALNKKFATGAGGALPTSHSIGDKDKNTSPIPVVTYFEIPTKGGFLLTLSDGLSDAMALNDVANFVQTNANQSAEKINQSLHIRKAQIGGGDDTTTVLTKVMPMKT